MDINNFQREHKTLEEIYQFLSGSYLYKKLSY